MPELKEIDGAPEDMIRAFIAQEIAARGIAVRALANAAGVSYQMLHRYLKYEPDEVGFRPLKTDAASRLLRSLSAKVVLET